MFIAIVWVVPIYVYYFGTESVVNNFVLGINPSQLWFLLMLFWVFVFMWPLSNFLNEKPVIGVIVVLLFYIIGLLAKPVPNYYCIKTGLMYMPFFYIGFNLRKYDNNIIRKIPVTVYVLCDLLLFIIVRYLNTMSGIVYKLLLFGCSFLLNTIGAIMIFILLQKIMAKESMEQRMNFLSKHSMTIYLVHQQLIYFSIGLFADKVSPVILVLINFVFSLSLSTIFAVLMSKSKITRILIGSK